MSEQRDILKRLGDHEAPYYESSPHINHGLDRAIDDAVEEIKRLREENDQLRKGAMLGPIVGASTIMEQAATLERLRAENARLREAAIGLAWADVGAHHARDADGYVLADIPGTAADLLVSLGAAERHPERADKIREVNRG